MHGRSTPRTRPRLIAAAPARLASRAPASARICSSSRLPGDRGPTVARSRGTRRPRLSSQAARRSSNMPRMLVARLAASKLGRARGGGVLLGKGLPFRLVRVKLPPVEWRPQRPCGRAGHSPRGKSYRVGGHVTDDARAAAASLQEPAHGQRDESRRDSFSERITSCRSARSAT